jgi:L-ascorbate metabolism protein UlaG (beta-lactamase superfamily)
LVSDLGFGDVVELNWWNSYRHAGLTVTHVPSRHWGARVLKDSHRGYGGYVLRDRKHSVYHAGDTAYFSGFREIGRRLAPELALLPIGAYDPPGFRNVHTNPADATRAFIDLNSRWMIPMHYGTFRLSHEPLEEPLQLLEQEAKALGIEDRLVVMEEGVTRFF